MFNRNGCTFFLYLISIVRHPKENNEEFNVEETATSVDYSCEDIESGVTYLCEKGKKFYDPLIISKRPVFEWLSRLSNDVNFCLNSSLDVRLWWFEGVSSDSHHQVGVKHRKENEMACVKRIYDKKNMF